MDNKEVNTRVMKAIVKAVLKNTAIPSIDFQHFSLLLDEISGSAPLILTIDGEWVDITSRLKIKLKEDIHGQWIDLTLPITTELEALPITTEVFTKYRNVSVNLTKKEFAKKLHELFVTNAKNDKHFSLSITTEGSLLVFEILKKSTAPKSIRHPSKLVLKIKGNTL